MVAFWIRETTNPLKRAPTILFRRYQMGPWKARMTFKKRWKYICRLGVSVCHWKPTPSLLKSHFQLIRLVDVVVDVIIVTWRCRVVSFQSKTSFGLIIWPFPTSFSFFCLLIVDKCSRYLKNSNDKIRTMDIFGRKPPLCQLIHYHGRWKAPSKHSLPKMFGNFWTIF